MAEKTRTSQNVKRVVAFAEVTQAAERTYLEKQFDDSFELLFFKETAQELETELAGADILSVFIKSKLDRALLESLPKLRLIATRSTGFDHIDLEAAKEKKISVSNVAAYGENTVAEHTFALILSITRNLRKAYFQTLQNNFSIEGLMGSDLKGKTLGVIGTGHIGFHVIRIAVGFGMNVLAYDIRKERFIAEVLNFEYVPLRELFSRSDILTLHLPHLPSTHHLINQAAIREIKKGAILINTARGGLVETEALIKALDEEILSGAGLDVLEEEELILEENRWLHDGHDHLSWQKLQTALKNHVLLNRPNVIYTPHIGFYSKEAVQRILDTTVRNIRLFAAGQPVNLVSESVGREKLPDP